MFLVTAEKLISFCTNYSSDWGSGAIFIFCFHVEDEEKKKHSEENEGQQILSFQQDASRTSIKILFSYSYMISVEYIYQN